MAAKKIFLSDNELQQAVETAAEELEVLKELDMSDEFSNMSDFDIDPTYSADDISSSHFEDDRPKKRKRTCQLGR